MTILVSPDVQPTQQGSLNRRKALTLTVGVGAGLALASGAGLAQSFPSKPIRILVGFAAGGSSDVAARMIARRLEKQIGQPVVVLNQPGNNGAIAANSVARSDPDGHTLYLGNISLLSPAMTKVGSVVVGKDLIPIGGVQLGPWFLFVRSNLPVKTVEEFVAYAKANPGTLNYGGASAVNILIAEVFKNHMGFKSLNVPYKGTTPVIAAMLGGEIDFTTDILPAYRGQIAANKIRPLLYFGDKRSTFFPDVPASKEIGFSEFAGTRTAMWGPGAMPKAIADRLSQELFDALSSAELSAEFRAGGSEPLPLQAADMGAAAARETQFWSEAARLTNFKPD